MKTFCSIVCGIDRRGVPLERRMIVAIGLVVVGEKQAVMKVMKAGCMNHLGYLRGC